MKSSVYAIRSERGLIKIGVSRNVAVRMYQLRSDFQQTMTLIFSQRCADAFGAERAAHRLLTEHRRFGEWFDVSPAQATHAIRRAVIMARKGIPRHGSWHGAPFSIRIADGLHTKIRAWADRQPNRPRLGTAIKIILDEQLALDGF